MKQFLFILATTIALSVQAQYKIVFTNADSSKKISIKQNDLVRIAYNGYMKQPQEAEGFVSEFTDSTITLSPRKKLFQKIKPAQTISIKDITGFRRYSKFRPAGEIIYGIAGIGITGTVTAIIAKANVSGAVGFLSAAGTGMVTAFIKNLVISNKIKNKFSNGWSMQLLPIN